MEAAKKSLFSGRTTKRGGIKDGPIRKKKNFKLQKKFRKQIWPAQGLFCGFPYAYGHFFLSFLHLLSQLYSILISFIASKEFQVDTR